MTAKILNNLDSIPQLMEENKFKFICLYNSAGQKLVNYNTFKKGSLETKIKEIQDKLNSPLTSSGAYRISMCESNRSGIPTEFIYNKSFNSYHTDYNMPQPQAPVIIQHDSNKNDSALSFESALSLNRENAELKSERMYLLNQISQLQEEIKELESDLKELEEKGLSENKNSYISTLTELAPSLLGSLGKYLEIQERKVALAEKPSVKTPESQPNKIYTGSVVKVFKTGSEAHLNYIDELVNSENFDKLAIELEKIKNQLPDLYNQIVEKYQISTNE